MDLGQELQREVRDHFKGHDLGQICTMPKDMGVNYLIRKAADAKTPPGCSRTRWRKGQELGAGQRVGVAAKPSKQPPFVFLIPEALTTCARSVLVISKSASHVTFIVKNLVTVEDVLPVDGSWVQKPVPPAGKMKGEMYLGCLDSNMFLAA